MNEKKALELQLEAEKQERKELFKFINEGIKNVSSTSTGIDKYTRGYIDALLDIKERSNKEYL